MKEAGKTTIAGRKIWFDDSFGRLNEEGKGEFLGTFNSEDRLLVIYSDGNYEITDTELSQRFDAEKIILMEKFDPEKIITAIYLDNEKLQFNVKRFKIETTTDRKCLKITPADCSFSFLFPTPFLRSY